MKILQHENVAVLLPGLENKAKVWVLILFSSNICRSKDEELDLLDVDKFYEEAPQEISQPVYSAIVLIIITFAF